MSDILPKLPPPPKRAPEKPVETAPTDSFLYGFGGTLLIGSQFLSRSAPYVAGKVSENIIGPEVALGAKEHKFRYPLSKAWLLLAPRPLGFVPPQEYGLRPNYLAGYNKFLTYDFPTLGFLKLPESHILSTLPDTDPHVKYELWYERGREQRRELEKLTPRAPLPELLELYALTQQPNANRFFFRPDDIATSLEASIRSRVGVQEGDRLITDIRQVAPHALDLPRPEVGTPRIPSALDPLPPIKPVPAFPVRTTAELFAELEATGAKRTVDEPPIDARQQVTFLNAKEPVKHLASERADP